MSIRKYTDPINTSVDDADYSLHGVASVLPE